MTSCIGNIQVKLDVDTWCRTFNIPNLTDQEEASVRSLSREEIFKDLFGREGLGIRSWVNVGELPKHPTIRLATTIIMNVLVPKKGSKEQIKEEEGRILYTLKHGFNLNVAKDIVERIRQICIRKSTPLCYVMHLMVIMKNAGVNLKCAGDVDIKELKKSSYIDARTLGRLGFKHDITDWIYVGRGKVRTRTYTAESQPQYQTRTEGQDTGEEQERTVEGEQAAEGAEAAEASSIPQPSTSRAKSPSFPSIPTSQLSKHITTLQTNLSNQVATLQTNLSNQITQHFTHLNEKMDYFMVQVNSRLENMDSKLDDINIRVKTCETYLNQPTPASQPSPASKPDQPSKQTSPQHIPSSSSSSSSATSSSISPIRPASPISTMSKDTPTEPTQTQTLAIEPPPAPQPPLEQPQPSETPLEAPQPAEPPPEQPQASEAQSPEKTLAEELVKKTLKLPRTTRTKRAVTKHSFKIVPRK